MSLLLTSGIEQVVKNNLNPSWKKFRVSMQALCGGDVEKTIKVNTDAHVWKYVSIINTIM